MSVSGKNCRHLLKIHTVFKYMMYAVGELADEILHEMVLEAQFPEERTPTCPGAAGMDVKRFDRHATKVGTEMFAALTHATGGITQGEAEWLADSSWTGRFVTLTEMSGSSPNGAAANACRDQVDVTLGLRASIPRSQGYFSGRWRFPTAQEIFEGLGQLIAGSCFK